MRLVHSRREKPHPAGEAAATNCCATPISSNDRREHTVSKDSVALMAFQQQQQQPPPPQRVSVLSSSWPFREPPICVLSPRVLEKGPLQLLCLSSDPLERKKFTIYGIGFSILTFASSLKTSTSIVHHSPSLPHRLLQMKAAVGYLGSPTAAIPNGSAGFDQGQVRGQ